MALFPEGHNQNGWTDFLSFLWDGGARSLIVVILVLGASGITIFNKDVCPGSPSQALPSATPSKESSSTSSNSNASTTLVQLVQPNPICSKYFELNFFQKHLVQLFQNLALK
jgi:hypothetical protein